MNFSTFLTVIRLFGSLTIVPFFLLHDWFSDPIINRLVCFALFTLLSLTDFFDGYLARRYNNVSSFGAFLDPIADKCLIITTLICLLARQQIQVFFVLVMIIREILILSLRQYSAEKGITISVSAGGKLKTVCQSVALMVTIIVPDLLIFQLLKNVLLLIATYFSLYSLYLYGKKALQSLTKK